MTPMLTQKVKVIGQRSMSPGQKNVILGIFLQLYRQCVYAQEPDESRSKVTWVKVKGRMGQGQGHQVKT